MSRRLVLEMKAESMSLAIWTDSTSDLCDLNWLSQNEGGFSINYNATLIYADLNMLPKLVASYSLRRGVRSGSVGGVDSCDTLRRVCHIFHTNTNNTHTLQVN